MRKRPGLAFVAAGIAVALALAGAALAALAGGSKAAATKVTVTEREYKITLSTKKLPAGMVTFTIHNTGKLTHELALSGGGLPATHTAAIKPGATRTLTVKLAGGTVSVWCPIPGHAALGMKNSFVVTGAAAASTPAPTPAPAPGTTTGGDAAWG